MTPPPEYTQAQLNTAQKFFQELLTDPAIAKAYGEIVKANIGTDGTAITKWLTAQGYPDISPKLIYIAMEQMKDHNMAFWTGIYGLTSLSTDKKTFKEGPVLIIEGSSSVLLDGVAISDFTYSQSKLSWTTSSNPTAASINFTQVTGVTGKPLPAGTYIGNEFSGTLTTDGSDYPIWAGKIGQKPTYKPPASAYKVPVIDQIFKYAGYVILVATAIMMGYKLGA